MSKKPIDTAYLKALDRNIPSPYCNNFQGIVRGKKNDNIGLMVTKWMVVTKVERGSVAENLLQFGDIITSVDDKEIESKKEFEKLLAKLSQSDYSIKIGGLRLTTKIQMEDGRFPKGYEPNSNHKYHIAVMYFIRGCKLALSVKSYNNKVYVTRVTEYTLAAMSLQKGDAILDVDSTALTTVTETSNVICEGLRKNGYVTLVIEQPNDPQAAAYVRMALLAEKSVEMDLPLAPDVIDICQQEYERMKRDPNLKPIGSILKTQNCKARSSNSRIQVNEKTEDVPIACEDNPALLMKVPTMVVPGKQQYFSLCETEKR